MHLGNGNLSFRSTVFALGKKSINGAWFSSSCVEPDREETGNETI